MGDQCNETIFKLRCLFGSIFCFNELLFDTSAFVDLLL